MKHIKQLTDSLLDLIKSGESETIEFKSSFGKEVIDEAMEFIKKNIRLGYDFTGELKRKETWQYPLPVLRELLLNAVIHKDYRNPTDVIIKIFDEHIEFMNPGKLFGNITLESLMTDFYKASHRNKLLAEAFYLTGEVEKYGTGFIRIRDELRNNYPDIKITLDINYGVFTATIGTASKTAPQTATKAAPQTAPKTATKAAPKTALKKNTREQILSLLKKNPKLTKQELMKELNKASGTIKEHIRILQREEKIKRVGSDKTGHWEVTS